MTSNPKSSKQLECPAPPGTTSASGSTDKHTRDRIFAHSRSHRTAPLTVASSTLQHTRTTTGSTVALLYRAAALEDRKVLAFNVEASRVWGSHPEPTLFTEIGPLYGGVKVVDRVRVRCTFLYQWGVAFDRGVTHHRV